MKVFLNFFKCMHNFKSKICECCNNQFKGVQEKVKKIQNPDPGSQKSRDPDHGRERERWPAKLKIEAVLNPLKSNGNP